MLTGTCSAPTLCVEWRGRDADGDIVHRTAWYNLEREALRSLAAEIDYTDCSDEEVVSAELHLPAGDRPTGAIALRLEHSREVQGRSMLVDGTGRAWFVFETDGH